MENLEQISDFAYKLITEENKKSEEVIKSLMKLGLSGKDAADIYYDIIYIIQEKENEPLYKASAEATASLCLIGRFFGHTEEWENGSYVTTEWIWLIVPIFPLNSYRVRLENEDTGEYTIYSKEKLNKKQVLKTYLVWYGGILILASGFCWLLN